MFFRHRSESLDLTISEKDPNHVHVHVHDIVSHEIMELMNEFENMEHLECNDDDVFFHEFENYDSHYTVKDLTLIHEYYYKTKKQPKAKKIDLITAITLFESNVENHAIVMQRKRLWYFIQELKNDSFMKKFVMWN